MEMTTVLGLAIGIGGILIGNLIEGGHLESLVQGAAFLIVTGGTAGAVLVSSKSEDIKIGLAMLKKAFEQRDDSNLRKAMVDVLDCARLARKDSILAIDSRINSMQSKFMANVMRAIVDGVDPKVLRDIFEKEIEVEEERLLSAAKIWTDAGGYAPTIGIIGAVLGLIHVMGNLSDTSKLGAGIATAFVATIYGVGFSNLIFLPIGSKLKKKVLDEMKLKEMILEGALCIQAGLSPVLVEIRMQSFIENG